MKLENYQSNYINDNYTQSKSHRKIILLLAKRSIKSKRSCSNNYRLLKFT